MSVSERATAAAEKAVATVEGLLDKRTAAALRVKEARQLLKEHLKQEAADRKRDDALDKAVAKFKARWLRDYERKLAKRARDARARARAARRKKKA